MSNSKMLAKCENCNQDYCCECTNAEEWAKFCSRQCEEEYQKERKRGAK